MSMRFARKLFESSWISIGSAMFSSPLGVGEAEASGVSEADWLGEASVTGGVPGPCTSILMGTVLEIEVFFVNFCSTIRLQVFFTVTFGRIPITMVAESLKFWTRLGSA